MARTRGPLFSMEASGSIGGAITYSRWKGRPYARSLVIPANPRSDAQFGFRAMMAYLSTRWASITPQDQATWVDRAEQNQYSPFNAYVSFNQLAWRQLLAPTEAFPTNRDANLSQLQDLAATGGVGEITGDIQQAESTGGVGAMLHMTPANDTPPAVSNCRLIIAGEGDDQQTPFRIGQVPPGTWFIRAVVFSADGRKLDPLTTTSLTVT